MWNAVTNGVSEDVRPGRGSARQVYRWCVGIVLGLVAATAFVAPARAQAGGEARAQQPATPQTNPNDPGLWNVDRMMEDAVGQISRRYNLNKEQENYTRLILVKRVKEFLKNNESEVRELLKESIDFRIGLKKDTADAVANWATRAAPIYDAAMKAILDGNKEWGEILDDKQKAIHQSDLALMNTNFTQVNATFQRWSKGDYRQGEIRNPVQPPPQTPTNPALANQQSANPPGPVERNIEDAWKTYVQKFIAFYKLDQKQTTSANNIHQEMLRRAANYRDGHKPEYAEIAIRLEQPSDDPKNPNYGVRVRERKQMLDRPIREMFRALRERLDGLLSQGQREAITPENKSELESIARVNIGESLKTGGDTGRRPSAPPTTQAASDTPTTPPRPVPVAPTSKPAANPTPAPVAPQPPAGEGKPPAAQPPATQPARTGSGGL